MQASNSLLSHFPKSTRKRRVIFSHLYQSPTVTTPIEPQESLPSNDDSPDLFEDIYSDEEEHDQIKTSSPFSNVICCASIEELIHQMKKNFK